MASDPVGVLIVDDDYYAREALRILLSRDRRTRVWGLAGDTDETLRLLAAAPSMSRPDVVLQDVRIAGEARAGIAAIPVLKETTPSSKVLVTSVERDEGVVLDAIRAGADGYVWKNESTDGIASAVLETAAGRFVVTRSIAERVLGKTVDLCRYAAEILPESHPYRELTEAMRETLHLYCTCGMSAREIAQELQVSVNTVYSRIKTAYHVLDARNRDEAFERFVSRVALP